MSGKQAVSSPATTSSPSPISAGGVSKNSVEPNEKQQAPTTPSIAPPTIQPPNIATKDTKMAQTPTSIAEAVPTTPVGPPASKSSTTKSGSKPSGAKKKSSSKKKTRKFKKSSFLGGANGSKKTRKWMRKWIEKKVLGGYKIKVLSWVSNTPRANAPKNERSSFSSSSKIKDPASIVRSYICQKCHKAFQDNSGLRKHMRIHGEKTFCCTWEGCSKRFIDNSKLKRHMLVHTGEKRFVCPYENCNKRFSLDFNLKSHMKRHARDRKFPQNKKKSSVSAPPIQHPARFAMQQQQQPQVSSVVGLTDLDFNFFPK